MKESDILSLFKIAQSLDKYTIDNGPMGENTPFYKEADKLREIAARQKCDEEIAKRPNYGAGTDQYQPR